MRPNTRNQSTQGRSNIGFHSGGQMAMEETIGDDMGTLPSDLQRLIKDERQLISRPKVLQTLGATVLATVGMAYYNGTVATNSLLMKALYATVAQILGLNVGLAMGNANVDNVAFAGLYYFMTSVSGNLSRYNQNNGMEAVAGAVAGYAANMYFSMPAGSGMMSMKRDM